MTATKKVQVKFKSKDDFDQFVRNQNVSPSVKHSLFTIDNDKEYNFIATMTEDEADTLSSEFAFKGSAYKILN
jgi:hypothetical protein